MSSSSSSLIDVPVAPVPAPRSAWLCRLWDGPRTLAARRAALAAITAAASAAATFLYVHDPAASGPRHWFPPCPFHALTGCYCPGCGSTRGLYHLLHGHLAAACRMNVLMVLCLPYLAYAYLAYATRACFPQSRWANPRAAPAKPLWIWLLLVVILLYWVLRNVPMYPFTLLAPH
jgi:hypothetical protein